MRYPFNYKTLALAVASVSMAMTAHGAAMDRSGQDVTAFLQDGTYAEAVYTYIDADVSGKDGATGNGNTVPNIVESYDFFRYGVKADVNDTLSVGVLYDEPFGAAVQYKGDNNLVAQSASATFDRIKPAALPVTLAQAKLMLPTLPAAQQQQVGALIQAAENAGRQEGQGTNVEIRTNNLTALVGIKLGENKNFQVYGGPAAQRVNGEVHLRGPAYGAITGYDASVSQDTAVGWVAGVSYSKPEIALRASLTYRSEIEHDTSIYELIPARGVVGTGVRDFSITTPESYNLDFQTGINPTTLLTAKVRYVPWSDFAISPPTYGDATNLTLGRALPIASYDKDQWSAEIGLGKRITDKLSVSAQVGWDSGAGNPVTSLGPVDGYYSLGLGAKYSFTPEWSLSVGGKYFKFGDATATLPSRPVIGDAANVGKFEDNDGYAVGVKLAYQRR